MPISKHLQKLRQDCRLHRGDVNPETLLPINKKGEHIFYGYRRCGIPDCINPQHWTTNIRHGRSLNGDRAKPLYAQPPTITGEQLHTIAKPLFRGTEPATCQVKNCTRPHRATNLCAKHSTAYTKWRKAQGMGRVRQDFTDVLPYVQPVQYSDMTTKQRRCHVPNCDRTYSARGLCRTHYNRFQRLQASNPQFS